MTAYAHHRRCTEGWGRLAGLADWPSHHSMKRDPKDQDRDGRLLKALKSPPLSREQLREELNRAREAAKAEKGPLAGATLARLDPAQNGAGQRPHFTRIQ
jgi:hypothetical protein